MSIIIPNTEDLEEIISLEDTPSNPIPISRDYALHSLTIAAVNTLHNREYPRLHVYSHGDTLGYILYHISQTHHSPAPVCFIEYLGVFGSIRGRLRALSELLWTTEAHSMGAGAEYMTLNSYRHSWDTMMKYLHRNSWDIYGSVAFKQIGGTDADRQGN